MYLYSLQIKVDSNKQKIIDTDKCIFVFIFVHICVYLFHICYIRIGDYPNHTHIIIVKNNLLKRRIEEEKDRRKKENQRR
jgi:hypothetical protein